MKTLNWGIIGRGWIAHEMGDALKAVKGEIYGVCATTRAGAQEYAREYGVAHVYDGTAQLLADPAIDIVYIATPHSGHYQIIKAALEAGKHVFCEKSITVSSRQLEECAAIAAEKRLVLCDGTTLLHMPLYRRLRQLIDSGAIGKVKMVQVNFGSCKEYDEKNRFFSKELAGGALLDIGVYAVSFARFFMSSCPNTVLTTANYVPTGVDETSGILLKNPDGEMAVIALTMLAKQPKRGVVAGEKGYIEIDNYPRAQRAVVVYTEDGRREELTEGRTEDALQYEVLDMERYVREGGGEQNLRLVRDVMTVITSVRGQWGLVYPSELSQ